MRNSIDRLVEQARPDDYYQAPDPGRRERDLDRALAGAQPRFGSTPHRSAPTRRRQVVLIAAGLATAAVVAVPLLIREPPTEPGATPGTTSSTPSTTPTRTGERAAVARAVLLQAAEGAGRGAVPSTARYWHHRALAIDVERAASGSLLIEQRRRRDLWIPRDPAGTSWQISQHLGARSLSGGGTSWKVRVGAPCPRKGMPDLCWTTKVVTGQPGRPERTRYETGAKPFAIGETNLSVDELSRLPGDPAKLKTKLLELARPLPGDRDAVLFEVASSLVSQLPTTPTVRAAGFRVLAGIPGVRLLPDAKDALGRPGTAVSLQVDHGASGAVENRLLFDQQTGEPLAYEARVVRPGTSHPGLPPGTRYLADVIETIDWTTNGPAKN